MGLETIAGLVLTAAGAGAQAVAAGKTRGAMNDVAMQQFQKQQEFARQGQQQFQQSLQQSTPQVAQQQIGEGQQQAAEATRNVQVLPFSSASAGSPMEQARVRQGNTANAYLQGYSNYALKQQIKDTLANRNFQVLNNLSQGYANLLPIQMQAAQQSQTGLNNFGQILGLGGGLLGLAGAVSPAATHSAFVMGQPTNRVAQTVSNIGGY